MKVKPEILEERIINSLIRFSDNKNIIFFILFVLKTLKSAGCYISPFWVDLCVFFSLLVYILHNATIAFVMITGNVYESGLIFILEISALSMLFLLPVYLELLCSISLKCSYRLTLRFFLAIFMFLLMSCCCYFIYW